MTISELFESYRVDTILSYKVQRVIAKKIYIQELWFLCSSRHPMLFNTYMKFHEDILDSFQVTEWTPFCDRQTDDPGKNNMSPNPKGGRYNGRFVQTVYTQMRPAPDPVYSVCQCISRSDPLLIQSILFASVYTDQTLS